MHVLLLGSKSACMHACERASTKMRLNACFAQNKAYERKLIFKKIYIYNIKCPDFPQFGPGLYKVRKVDSSKRPPIFYLSDLTGRQKSLGFYRSELKKSSPPQPRKTFEIGTILRSKTKNNKTYHYCKFKDYDKRHSRWVAEDEMTI